MPSLFLLSAISLLVAVTSAQPQSAPLRATRAITLVDSDLFLYGGSAPSGECFSDLYNLHLDPEQGWAAGNAPWTVVNLGATAAKPSQPLGLNSWAVGSGEGLFVYGQTLCPNELAKDTAKADHTFFTSSASAIFHVDGGQWSQGDRDVDVLGPRLVKDDIPVPVQVVDTKTHTAYTFVYDAFNPQLGMQLWSFSTEHPPTKIASDAKNITMLTRAPTPAPPPPPPVPSGNSTTNTTAPIPVPAPVAAPAVLAPFVDIGSAVFLNGEIIVVGGKKIGDSAASNDDVDAASGYYKTDRCWTYNVASNSWQVRTLTSSTGVFPTPRRLAALVTVGNHIFMHGGNTSQTVPTESFAKDMWILDTTTWQWSPGVSSATGRASHTLLHYGDTLLTVSGYEFENSKSKSGKNAYIMVYDMAAGTWGAQFGTVTQTYFQRHSVAIITGSLAGFLVLLGCVSLASRALRHHKNGRPINVNTLTSSSLGRKPSRPFMASTAHRSSTYNVSSESNSQAETAIDLSALPRAMDSGRYDQHQYNPYSSSRQQQNVPLMSANALEQQDHEGLEPYQDDHSAENVQRGSYVYPGQTFDVSGVAARGEMATRAMTPDGGRGFP